MTSQPNIVERLRAGLSSAWRGWKGPAGDDTIVLGGLVALLFHIAEGNAFPAPLPVAVFACLLVLGRQSDRLSKVRTS